MKLPRTALPVAIGCALLITLISSYFLKKGGKGFSLSPYTLTASNTRENLTAIETLLKLELPDINGTYYSLSQWGGKVLVINFWATWCPPCRQEMPDFATVSRHLQNEPVQFVGMSIDTEENIRQFQQTLNPPYPLLIAPSSTLKLTASLGNTIQGLPATLILDQSGTLHHFQIGPLNANELEGKIRSLLHPETGANRISH